MCCDASKNGAGAEAAIKIYDNSQHQFVLTLRCFEHPALPGVLYRTDIIPHGSFESVSTGPEF